jgi:phosphohistidine phosphatase
MKTLFLLRHASAEAGEGPDRERPLAPEGRVEAQAMASYLATAAPRPDRILTSDALRALETAAAVSEALGIAPAETDAQLYLASPGEILGCVQDFSDSAEAVLIVAHNPGIGSLARALPGEAPEQNRTRLSGFPPAALAVVVFPDADWADVAAGRGRLVNWVRPSDLL